MFYRLRRKLNRYRDEFLYRITHKSLLAALRRVGVEPGMTICVHSAMSRMGHFDGGPQMVIETLMEAVGTSGTVLMPSFPMSGTMVGWLDSGEVFDVRNTPSKVGTLTEVFRKTAGVQRSLHPTNPVAGSGRSAAEILRGHEKSLTPYGNETPYGRLSARNDGYVLMLSTYLLSILHHLQERVDFPNLYLPGERDVACIDGDGNRKVMRTRVMRPRVPYYIAIPGARGGEPDWAILHDYALPFPATRYQELEADGYKFEGYPAIYRRREELTAAGMLKTTRLGKSEIGLARAKPMMEKYERELGELIERYRPYYDADAIAARNLPFS
jgi:aminoglycoside 3-N-acetyltransferase